MNGTALAGIDVDRFYDLHLARVSRSFAFCIPRLEPPFRSWVSLSYLLLRVLDTIEDSPWTTGAERERQFDELERMIAGDRIDVQRWIDAFPSAVSEAERLLLADTPQLISDLHALPPPVYAAIARTLHAMSQGMRYFLGRPQGMHLESVGEANLYCFFVAGLVGEMLTLLFTQTTAMALDDDLLVDAHRFGRFLQKVNILKDAAEDRAAGRHLVPGDLAASLRDDAGGAIAYLLRLPSSARGYRLFCAWSLFLGLTTVTRKRSRADVELLLARVESIVRDDDALRALFLSYAAALPDGAFDAAPFAAMRAPVRTSLSRRALRVLGLDILTEIRG